MIRVSFSNMFKEFKSTATWLQFPFLCGAAHCSVYENTASTAKQGRHSLIYYHLTHVGFYYYDVFYIQQVLFVVVITD